MSQQTQSALPEEKPAETPVEENVQAAPEPRWFNSPQYAQDRPEQLAERYRRTPVEAHGPTDEAFEEYHRQMTGQAARPRRYASPDVRMAAFPERPVLPRRHVEGQNAYYGRRKTRAAPLGLGLGASFVLASLLAVLAGGGIGYGITKLEDVAASAQMAAAKPATPVLATTVTGPGKTKPVTMARLDVADVTGSLNSMVPLLLRAEPASGMQPVSFKVTGLPKDAYLTHGKRTGADAWLLQQEDAKDLMLFIPPESPPKFDLSVAAIETKTGELAAPIKEVAVALKDQNIKVLPASAEPVNRTGKADAEDADALVGKADVLLKSGDPEAARKLFEEAFAAGAPEGAFGAAKTYDPIVLAEIDAAGAKPDAEKALDWYRKAAEAGDTDADAAIAKLETRGLP